MVSSQRHFSIPRAPELDANIEHNDGLALLSLVIWTERSRTNIHTVCSGVPRFTMLTTTCSKFPLLLLKEISPCIVLQMGGDHSYGFVSETVDMDA